MFQTFGRPTGVVGARPVAARGGRLHRPPLPRRPALRRGRECHPRRYADVPSLPALVWGVDARLSGRLVGKHSRLCVLLRRRRRPRRLLRTGVCRQRGRHRCLRGQTHLQQSPPAGLLPAVARSAGLVFADRADRAALMAGGRPRPLPLEFLQPHLHTQSTCNLWMVSRIIIDFFFFWIKDLLLFTYYICNSDGDRFE